MGLVKIRNVGDEHFSDVFNGEPYNIPPETEIIADAEVACLWLGYPALVDDPARARFDRTEKFNHLRQRYGWANGFDAPEAWEQMRPKLEVYTMAGERVWMILDDPEGTQAKPQQDVASPEDVEWLKDQFKRQEEELEGLRALIQAKDAQGGVPDKVQEDKPRKVPVKTGAGRGASQG